MDGSFWKWNGLLIDSKDAEINLKQEGIPVGCVPPACRPRGWGPRICVSVVCMSMGCMLPPTDPEADTPSQDPEVDMPPVDRMTDRRL